ncbi:MAG: tetratricopeptide repeat protein [Boseongicola sp.]|nr:tetratricopeptide repeat protein [Boseongicola sp.]
MYQQPVNREFPSVTLGGSLRTALFIFGIAAPVHAVEQETYTAPPSPTETTLICANGLIFDDTTKVCVSPEVATDDQTALYLDARELAWAGRLEDANRVLNRMEPSDKVLNYNGFVARKSGDWESAERFYLAAIDANPNNLLARSYYGQGLVDAGLIEAAEEQLTEIRVRGGRQTWPEISLRLHLEGADSGY